MDAKKSKSKNHWLARIIVLIVLAAVLGVSLFWQDSITRALGLKKTDETAYEGMHTDEVIGSQTQIGGDLNIHFVDVGQGDACIVELPDEKKLIIDGGKDKEKQKLLDYIPANITREGEPLEYFDYAILTHADEDHCGGLDDVLEAYPAKTFYRPNEEATYKGYTDPGKADLKPNHGAQSTLAYKRTVEAGYRAAAERGGEVLVTDASDETQRIVPENVPEDSEEFYSLTFYTPISNDYTDHNDYSPIMILEYKGKRVTLSGDAEKKAEAEFVSRVEAAKTDGVTDKYDAFDDAFTVDVIKLGHHGSRTSSSEAYLETMTAPDSRQNVIVIVSCGTGNSYGHPHSEVIDRLIGMGFAESNILRTDVNGTLAVSVRKEDETGQFAMFAGADVVRVERNTVRIGIAVEWRELALTIWIAVALVLVVQPLIKKGSASYRRVVREASGTGRNRSGSSSKKSGSGSKTKKR